MNKSSPKFGQNIYDHVNSKNEIHYEVNQIRVTCVICPWISGIAIFDFKVYTPHTNANESL